MAPQSLIQILALASLMLPSSTQSQSLPFQVPSSSKAYGPDGPWQAVNVFLGDDEQSIDLFPGGAVTYLLTSKKCNKAPVCGTGGLFDKNSSNSYVSLDDPLNYGYGDFVLGLLNFSGLVDLGQDTLQFNPQSTLEADLTVSNLSIALYDDVTLTIGNGVPYPIQAGQLGLSPPTSNVSLASSNGTVIPGGLASQGLIPSNSFGLHYGSAALKQNLSLWLGGYDQERLVGPVSSQPPFVSGIQYSANLEIDLFDIGIGTEVGGSPFPFASKQGLLAANNATIKEVLPVVMDPYTPFLALPNSTCRAIAATLPVTYNSTLQLYLWDTAAPSYTPIVTSPAYLSFTFRLSLSSSTNFTIKVPFSLLNLTLEPPLVPTPTPYFPCQTPPDFDVSYSLGRAFLQAAFIGGNWDSNVNKWYLAQAPGPNIATEPIPVAFTSALDSVNSSSNAWADTWKHAWTPLPGDSSSTAAASGTPTPTPSSGLSAGAIAGIVIGVLLALALVAAGAFFLILRQRRRRRRGALINSNNSTSMAATPYQDHHSSTLGHSPSDVSRPEFKQEMGGEVVHEMGQGEEGKERVSELYSEEGGGGRGERGGMGELDGTSAAGGSPRIDEPNRIDEEEESGTVGGVSPRLDLELSDTGGDFAEGLMGRGRGSRGGSRRESRRVSALS